MRFGHPALAALAVWATATAASARSDLQVVDAAGRPLACSQAQAFARQHSYYLKQTMGTILKIDVIPHLDNLICPDHDTSPAPSFDMTTDDSACVLGYYCARTHWGPDRH